MLGSLHASLASLRQTLDQLADFHERHAPTAPTSGVRELASEVAAEIAAAQLREAAALLEQTSGRLSAAWSHNGRIVWQPDPPAPPSPSAALRRLAGRTSFGEPPTSSGGGGITR